MTRRALVMVAALAVAACGNGGSASTASSTTSSSLPAPGLVAAVEGLCAARAEADADVYSVSGTFYDRSHEALHTIARALEPVDRPLAARLLEAKEAVEADVSTRPPKPATAADLDHLIDVTRQGLARLSVTTPPCR